MGRGINLVLGRGGESKASSAKTEIKAAKPPQGRFNLLHIPGMPRAGFLHSQSRGKKWESLKKCSNGKSGIVREQKNLEQRQPGRKFIPRICVGSKSQQSSGWGKMLGLGFSGFYDEVLISCSTIKKFRFSWENLQEWEAGMSSGGIFFGAFFGWNIGNIWIFEIFQFLKYLNFWVPEDEPGNESFSLQRLQNIFGVWGNIEEFWKLFFGKDFPDFSSPSHKECEFTEISFGAAGQSLRLSCCSAWLIFYLFII